MENFAEYGARLAEIESGNVQPVEATQEREAVETLPQTPDHVEEPQEVESPAPVAETPDGAQDEPATEAPKTPLHKLKVNGKEKEVTYDDLVALAQKGDDYSYRMEQLRAKAMELEAAKPFVDALTQNQAFREYVAQFGKNQPPAAPVSDDPVEQFRAEIAQQVLNQIKPQVEAPIQQVQQRVIESQIINHVKADDPDGSVRAEVKNFLSSLPGHLDMVKLPDGREVPHPATSSGLAFETWQRMNADPQMFMSVYASCKERVKAKPAATPQPTGKPTAVTTRAPILEGGGPEQVDAASRTRRQEMQALRDRAQSGDLAAAGKILDMIQSSKKR